MPVTVTQDPPRARAGGLIEIAFSGYRLRAAAGSRRRRCGWFSTCWSGDDPGPERRQGLAGGRPDRYAA